MNELRPKQKRFVKEYIKNGGNATQAVIDAGYDVKDRKVASIVGAENLAKPSISVVIKNLADAIPNELVTEKHKALLNKTDADGNIDVQAVKAGVEMAYKIKGSYVNDGSKPEIIIMPVLVKFLKDEPNNS